MAEGWVAARVVDLTGGRVDPGDGDGLPAVTSVCGDTLYSISHDTTGEPHLAVADALARHFGCTPGVTW
ncbi:hypothetical protein [Euzebya sp.]|uniref:hypothetical protein n=1 Tax=Euzebya sp. TaxID=1971409 RepID=UPI0035138298